MIRARPVSDNITPNKEGGSVLKELRNLSNGAARNKKHRNTIVSAPLGIEPNTN